MGRLRAGVAELADAPDSKSGSPHGECGFDSLLRHQYLASLVIALSRCEVDDQPRSDV
jgi:hypothetical protein